MEMEENERRECERATLAMHAEARRVLAGRPRRLSRQEINAIRLFVAAGNPAVLWHAIDEAERLPYRLEAASSRSSRPRQSPRQPLAQSEPPAEVQRG